MELKIIMKRLLIFEKTTNLNNVINVHDNYYKDMICMNTKKHYIAGSRIMPGYFYLTKFNPDVRVYEEFMLQNPETITIQINRKDIAKLQHIVNLASGLDLINGVDYYKIKDETGELVGLSFIPLDQEMINALVRVLDDEIGMA